MEIKTCSSCRYGYMWNKDIWSISNDCFEYKCLKHDLRLTEEEYHSCSCDDWESKDIVGDKKRKINFKKVKED